MRYEMNDLNFCEDVPGETLEEKEARRKRVNGWLARKVLPSKLETVPVDWLDEGMKLSVMEGEVQANIYYQGFREETIELFKNNEALISDLLAICADLGGRVYVGTSKHNNWGEVK
jgi:hypothetical protein